MGGGVFRPGGVVCHEQFDRQHWLAQAACGIQAGSDGERDVASGYFAQALVGAADQRKQACTRGGVKLAQTRMSQRPVFGRERNDIANGSNGYEVEQAGKSSGGLVAG